MKQTSSIPQDRIHLQLLAGVHYNPVIETKTYQPITQTYVEDPIVDNEPIKPDFELEEDLTPLWTGPASINPDCSCKRGSKALTSIQIGDKHLCALLDTGADISLIREDVWLSLPACVREKAKVHIDYYPSINGVGESEVEVSQVVQLPLTIMGHKLTDTFTFAVVPIEMSFCALLGANFITQHQVLLDFSCSKFSFTHDGEQFTYSLAPSVDPPLNVHYCYTSQYSANIHKTLSPLLDLEELRNIQQGNRTLCALSSCVANHTEVRDWKLRSLERFKKHVDKLSIEDDLLWYTREFSVPVVTFHFLVGFILSLHTPM